MKKVKIIGPSFRVIPSEDNGGDALCQCSFPVKQSSTQPFKTTQQSAKEANPGSSFLIPTTWKSPCLFQSLVDQYLLDSLHVHQRRFTNGRSTTTVGKTRSSRVSGFFQPFPFRKDVVQSLESFVQINSSSPGSQGSGVLFAGITSWVDDVPITTIRSPPPWEVHAVAATTERQCPSFQSARQTLRDEEWDDDEHDDVDSREALVTTLAEDLSAEEITALHPDLRLLLETIASLKPFIFSFENIESSNWDFNSVLHWRVFCAECKGFWGDFLQTHWGCCSLSFCTVAKKKRTTTEVQPPKKVSCGLQTEQEGRTSMNCKPAGGAVP